MEACMDSIRKSVVKSDHKIKVDGSAKYIADIKFNNSLHAKTLRSEKAKAIIKNIVIPDLKDGYYVVEGKDVPGLNKVKVIQNDMPIFADKEVNYIGEPILLVVGPKLEEVIKILNEIKVEYEDNIPVFDIRTSKEIFAKYEYEKGNIKKRLKRLQKSLKKNFIQDIKNKLI